MSVLSIFAPHRFSRLLAADALNISRDPMLIFASLMSLTPSIGLYLGRDALDAAALSTFSIESLSRFLVPVALTIPAFLIGWVTGFLLLEDRDEGTLLAVDVTPVGKSGFLAYRVAITALVTAAVTLFGIQLMATDMSWPMRLVIAALIAAESVAATIVLPAIARNKVEGLALTKVTNLVGLAALVPLVPSPLRYFAAPIPTYWIGELLGLGAFYQLPFVAMVVLAIFTHLAAVWLLFRLFQKRAG